MVLTVRFVTGKKPGTKTYPQASGTIRIQWQYIPIEHLYTFRKDQITRSSRESEYFPPSSWNMYDWGNPHNRNDKRRRWCTSRSARCHMTRSPPSRRYFIVITIIILLLYSYWILLEQEYCVSYKYGNKVAVERESSHFRLLQDSKKRNQTNL